MEMAKSWGEMDKRDLLEASKEVCIEHPFLRPQPLGENCTQLRIAETQPSSWGHSIGLVLKLGGPQLKGEKQSETSIRKA